MAKRDQQDQQNLTFDEMMSFLDSEFQRFPEHRAGNAVRYELADVLKSAFAMFALKSPSLLDFKKQTIAEEQFSNDLIFPRDSREPAVILGGRWSLDDYICRELIYCRHGDRSEAFVQALELSTLATLSVKVSGRIAEQTNEADEAR